MTRQQLLGQTLGYEQQKATQKRVAFLLPELEPMEPKLCREAETGVIYEQSIILCLYIRYKPYGSTGPACWTSAVKLLPYIQAIPPSTRANLRLACERSDGANQLALTERSSVRQRSDAQATLLQQDFAIVPLIVSI